MGLSDGNSIHGFSLRTSPLFPAASAAAINGMNPTAQVMNRSFVQASYNNSNLQACSFFMPSTLPDGSAVSAFSIRPIGLDG